METSPPSPLSARRITRHLSALELKEGEVVLSDATAVAELLEKVDGENETLEDILETLPVKDGTTGGEDVVDRRQMLRMPSVARVSARDVLRNHQQSKREGRRITSSLYNLGMKRGILDEHGMYEGDAMKWDDLNYVTYLAQGAMCKIYTAFTPKKQKVVLKVPREDGPPEAVNDLRVEVLMLAKLDHVNIISLVGDGMLHKQAATPGASRPFACFEFLGGGTLNDRICGCAGRKIPLHVALSHAGQLADALLYLHEEALPGRVIIHRDLKPDNIGFTYEGKLKLFDFGLAKVVKRKYRYSSEVYVMTAETGSPRFMAPEVAMGEAYNEKVDVFSWSLILWAIATKSMPFTQHTDYESFLEHVLAGGERPPLPDHWPAGLRELLTRSWDPDAEKRPAMSAIVEEMASMSEEERGIHRANSGACSGDCTVS